MGARLRRVGLLVTIVAAATLAYACGGDDDDDGRPTGLDGGSKDASPADATPIPVDATQPPKDTGAPEAAAPPFKCADAGASVVDASACAVSFKTDILPSFSGCSGCHAAGANKPTILTGDADATWRALAGFTSKVNRPLVNPCSTVVADSVLVQTLDPTVNASERGSLMPPGAGLASAVPKVKQWVECGAPNN